MLRRLQASSAHPRHAVRTRMTGFNLFTQEMQRKHKILGAKSLSTGQRNMKVMSKLWKQMTSRRRQLYNMRGKQHNTLLVSDSIKKNNNFNLIMRLFSGEKMLLNAGDEAFTALLAKSTMQAMSEQDTQQLKSKLKVNTQSATEVKSNKGANSAFLRFTHPHMKFFDSFTEMQRSVTPTRQSAFVAVSKLLSVSNVSEAGEEYVLHNFKSLSKEESHLFTPISDEEAPFFEVFCAARCSTFDHTHFNILRLFTAFRGIDVHAPHKTRREAVYRSLFATDRTHDGTYYRARRCLEKMQALRSSDCGLHFHRSHEVLPRIAPTAYAVTSTMGDVEVATLLADTRNQQSVYDDVLERAALLRPQAQNEQLDVYRLSNEEMQAADTSDALLEQQTMKVTADNKKRDEKMVRAKVLKSKTVEPKVTKPVRKLKGPAVQMSVKAPAVLLEAVRADARVMPRADAAVALSATLLHPPKSQLKTKRRATATSTISAALKASGARNGRLRAKKQATATYAVDQSLETSEELEIPKTRLKANKQAVITSTVLEALEEPEASEVPEAPKRGAIVTSTKTKEKKSKRMKKQTQPVEEELAAAEEETIFKSPTSKMKAIVEEEEEDHGNAEFFMESESAVDEDEDEVLERTMAASSMGIKTAVVQPQTAKRARAKRVISARSHLSDPASILPAHTRVQRVIRGHAAARRKARPSSSSSSSVAVMAQAPHGAKNATANFTDSIRQMLAGMM